MVKHYAKRYHMAQGRHYLAHVEAMTAEDLHAKSAIAAEFAHRDIQIDALAAENERLRKTLKSLLDEMLIKDCTLRNYDVYHVSKGEVQLARAVLRVGSEGKENV